MTETPDIENAVKTYLTARGLTTFFGIPDSPPNVFTTVSRIGGGAEAGKDAALDVARLTLPCWGTTKREAGDRARAVADAIREVEMTELAPGVVGYSGEVDSLLWLPAPDNGRPRYIVDVTISALATATP